MADLDRPGGTGSAGRCARSAMSNGALRATTCRRKSVATPLSIPCDDRQVVRRADRAPERSRMRSGPTDVRALYRNHDPNYVIARTQQQDADIGGRRRRPCLRSDAGETAWEKDLLAKTSGRCYDMSFESRQARGMGRDRRCARAHAA